LQVRLLKERWLSVVLSLIDILDALEMSGLEQEDNLASLAMSVAKQGSSGILN
jgi:hypothetical protein